MLTKDDIRNLEDATRQMDAARAEFRAMADGKIFEGARDREVTWQRLREAWALEEAVWAAIDRRGSELV